MKNVSYVQDKVLSDCTKRAWSGMHNKGVLKALYPPSLFLMGFAKTGNAELTSGLLVAASIRTPERPSKPSNSVSS